MRRVARLGSGVLLVGAIMTIVVFAGGPWAGAWRTVSILTGSMDPTFEAGDAIVSTPTPARDLRRGDVITFHAPVDGRPLVTHRVVEVVDGGAHPKVRTRGDANRAADPWVARIQDDTVWTQRAVIPNAGHAIALLRRPGTRHVLLYGALVAFLVLGLRSIWTLPAERVA